MAAEKPNPIVRFTYSESLNAYTTLLEDGSPGPNISLNDMFVLKDLVAMESVIDLHLTESTTVRNDINLEIKSLGEIKNDIDINYPKVQQEIKKLKEKIG